MVHNTSYDIWQGFIFYTFPYLSGILTCVDLQMNDTDSDRALYASQFSLH